MTTDKQLKQRVRDLALAEGISYTQALYRLDPARAARQRKAPGIFKPEATEGISALSWEDLNAYLDETEAALERSDPYRRAAAHQHRATLYYELGAHTTDPTYKAACYRAAICDETSAARIRFHFGIPSLFPKRDTELLGIGNCASCGRPWQTSQDGACPDCPRLNFGPTPSSGGEARKWAAKPEQPSDEVEAVCLGRNMDCGRKLPCPDHPASDNRPDPGYYGRPVDDPDGEAAYLAQEHQDAMNENGWTPPEQNPFRPLENGEDR